MCSLSQDLTILSPMTDHASLFLIWDAWGCYAWRSFFLDLASSSPLVSAESQNGSGSSSANCQAPPLPGSKPARAAPLKIYCHWYSPDKALHPDVGCSSTECWCTNDLVCLCKSTMWNLSFVPRWFFRPDVKGAVARRVQDQTGRPCGSTGDRNLVPCTSHYPEDDCIGMGYGEL